MHTPTHPPALLHAFVGTEKDDNADSPLFPSIAVLKRQLLLTGQLEAEEGGHGGPPQPLPLRRLLHIDLLYALIRLAGHLVAVASSDDTQSTTATTTAIATATGFLQRTARALDLQAAWQEAAAGATTAGGSGTKQPAAWAWAARRLPPTS